MSVLDPGLFGPFPRAAHRNNHEHEEEQQVILNPLIRRSNPLNLFGKRVTHSRRGTLVGYWSRKYRFI